MPAVIAEASEVEALVTSDCTASDPAERPAPVRVLVVAPQISLAIATPDVREREVYAHTLAGIAATLATRELSVEPSDDEAAKTLLFVVEILVLAVASVAPRLDEALFVLLLIAV